MVNLLHTFEMSGFLTDFQNFSKVFHSNDDLFRVIVDRITRLFNDSGATWPDFIYQRNRISDRVKHLRWSFLRKLLTALAYFRPTFIF